MSADSSREEGLRLLRERLAAIPELVRTALAAPITVGGEPARGRIVATGVGSSAAHARFLVSVLNELGLAARFAPATAFLSSPAATAADETLIVFSQGLSPNVRPALAGARAWREVWLLTAAHAPVAGTQRAPGGDEDARRAARREAEDSGVRVLSFPGADEYGTLLRVVGPMTGYAAALQFAACAAGGRAGSRRAPWMDVAPDVVASHIVAATASGSAGYLALGAAAFERNLAFVASGSHGERMENLRLKMVEGMLRPSPPVWDLLDLAHGPYQQLVAGEATLLACLHADSAIDDLLLARLRTMLDPARHTIVPLLARLPGPLAIFEHESMLNALVLAYIEERRLDQANWPGKGTDGPLYDFTGTQDDGAQADSHASSGRAVIADPSVVHRRAARAGAVAGYESARPAARNLEAMTWQEVEALVCGGRTVGVLPLGSTEQHGPHLPLATDTWIAAELARRLVARLDDAVQLPVLAFGCAREHLGFAGTLSLQDETLTRLLCDVAASLERHGFARLFVFSGHGGNREALAVALPRMREAAPRLSILAAPGLGVSMDALHGASARHGVAAAASGHHAGEFETSILLQLHPASVRTDKLLRGLEAVGEELDEVFYPDLRANAAAGVVGDPRGADAARAHEYIETWVESLLECYRRDESWAYTKGR